MDYRLLVIILITSQANGIGDDGVRGRYLPWNPIETYIANLFQYVRNGITALIGNGKVVRSERAHQISYNGYQVLRVEVARKKDAEVLLEMSDEIDGLEFWTRPTVGRHADVLVNPDSISQVKKYLTKRTVSYEVMIYDVQKLIAYENPKMNQIRRAMLIGRRGHTMTWTMYHRFSDMLEYMQFLENSFQHLVQLITIGYSTEGLPLKVIKISDSKDKTAKRMAIWIDGGMHGREWITSSVVLYIAKEIVEKCKNYKKLINQIDWYLMPVANPDGYEYSHKTDRLWKKTRSKYEIMSNDLTSRIFYGPCEGVDLNQNFDFHWAESGTSEDPCSDTYAGPRPFSEPESKAISHFIMDHKDDLKIFVTFHSYSQMWLLPSRYSNNKTSDTDRLWGMAKIAVDATRGVLGNSYGVDVDSKFYSTSGCSHEWAKEVADIKYAYLVELRDRAHYGFLLPANQILPTAKETFMAIKRLVTMIISKRKYR